MTETATVTITRKELYERVWTESVAHLGFKLGVWRTRLAKICAKNRVPVPDRVYWFYSTADRKTRRVPLPDPDQDWAITFAPSQPGPPKPEEGALADRGIVVPDHLSRPHRLVREARAAKTQASYDYDGRMRFVGSFLDILVSPACRNRALRIMDALIKACEARGWTVRIATERHGETIVSVQGCDIGVELLECLRQQPRELSETEQEWEARRE